jgi:hypothetical protein
MNIGGLRQNSVNFIESKQQGERDWTILYFGAGNLYNKKDENRMRDYMTCLAKAGSDDKIAFVAELVRGSKGAEAQRILLKSPPGPNGYEDSSEVLENLGFTDTTAYRTLGDFIAWGMEKFPAKHYMVIANGHGNGFRGAFRDDRQSANMSIPKIEKAFKLAKEKTGKCVDVLALNSCLMGNAETAYAVRDSVNYIVASEETISMKNWNYEELGASLKKESDGDGLTIEEALTALVECQQNEYLHTTSVIDCSKLSDFGMRLKSFADRLIYTDTPVSVIKESIGNAQHYKMTRPEDEDEPEAQMRDIVSIAEEIKNNDSVNDEELKKSADEIIEFIRNELVIYEEHDEAGRFDRSNGLSIYAPVNGADDYEKIYRSFSIAKDTNWDKVIKKYGCFNPNYKKSKTT